MGEKNWYKGHMSAYKFGQFIGNFDLETYAASKEEAKSNFAYQVKRKLNMLPGAKIELEGRITIKNI